MIIISLPGNQVPANLVPRTKARVEIKYKLGKKQVLTADQVKRLIQGALNECLEWTIEETEIWINNHVPERSGDLKESLLKFLSRSRPPAAAASELRGIRLILGVGANIDYAKYVNKMTISNVRHFNTWLEHSGKKAYSKGKPVLLNDFRAVGEYHDQMITFAKERLVINLAKAKYDLTNSSSLHSRNLSQLQVS